MEGFRIRQTPWKCRYCKRLNKAAATYCGQRGRHWANALDGKYQHPQRPSSQRQVHGDQSYTHWEEDAPWTNQAWDSGRWPSRSPRHGPRSQTPKGRKPKNRGKKNKQKPEHETPPLPSSPWSGDGGGGKGQSAPAVSAHSGQDGKTESKVDQKYRQLMSVLKKNEANLTPDLQQLVQENSIAQSQDLTKQLHSAVSKLGQAKKTVQRLRASRQNLHHVWRTYIAESVNKWKTFCDQFNTQDNDLAKQLQEALQAVSAAQERLELTKTETKEGKSGDQVEPDETMVEVSDEDSPEVLDSNGAILREGMQDMLKNLEALKHQAEAVAEPEHVKRARIDGPDGPDGTGDGNGAFGSPSNPGQSFAKPGQ
eukprot:s676_g25.t1